MSVTEKINDYLLKKVSRSKIQHLFMVSKEYLFNQVHELSEEVEELREKNKLLNKSIDGLQMINNNILSHSDDLRKENELFQRENNTLKKQLEAHTDDKYKLAYERLSQKFEDLTKENREIKKTIDTVSNVLDNTEKQNKQLKEQYKILSTQNLRLTDENKKYKEKENVIEIKKVNHNFAKKVNNNNRVLSR